MGAAHDPRLVAHAFSQELFDEATFKALLDEDRPKVLASGSAGSPTSPSPSKKGRSPPAEKLTARTALSRASDGELIAIGDQLMVTGLTNHPK